jgi:hypothetical protein
MAFESWGGRRRAKTLRGSLVEDNPRRPCCGKYCPGLATVARFEGGVERDISRYAALGVGNEHPYSSP